MLWVFLGGGVGASLRYFIVNIFTKNIIIKADTVSSVSAFPLPVMLINIAGSFGIGILAQIVSRETFANYTFLQPFLITGILGGFTTFSAFSFEAITLIQADKIGYAAFYIIGSVILSIGAAYFGYILAK